MNHIDYPVVPKPHTPMYLMHKYWARKPHNVVSEYIKNYTKTGEIVLDPFCGSGPTPIEAIKSGRKAIAIDLDPVATFITRITALPIDVTLLKSIFDKIEKNCKDKIEKLYSTTCPLCKKPSLIVYTIRENDQIIEIGYECSECIDKSDTNKRFLIKKPDLNDKKLVNDINKMNVPFWYPTDRLAYNGIEFKEGTRDPNITTVDKLFDKRALISLSILYNEIEKISDRKISDFFKLMFTSNVHNVSKLNPVHQPRYKKGMHPSTSWIIHRYWIPSLRVECPVWFYFNQRFNHIVEGKKDSNSQISTFNEAKKFDDLLNKSNFFIKTYNAIELTDIIPKESVDYVFTDPPYGGAIQYFELSTLWASWLRGSNNDTTFDLKFKDEITINPAQKKNFDYYHKMLKASFDQIYQVLKPGKWMTVTFHSTDIRIWNSIIKAVVLAGFDLEKIIYQPPPRASAKGLLQPYGSAVGDYYIRFRKPTKKKLPATIGIDESRYERIVVEAAKRIIAERGEPTMYQHILNGIVIELQKENALLLGEKRIDDVMKAHLGKEFVHIPVKKDGKTVGNKWWFKDPSSVPYLERVSLYDRVETAIVEELNQKIKVSFDEILQSIFIKFPNALTPETQDINIILDEYAEKAAGGKWRLKASVKVRIGEHGKMTYYLLELGKKLGYNIWIAPGIGSIYNGKSLYEQNDKKSTFRFIPSDYQDKVKQIDVLWYKDEKIAYEFEIENTTSITEAITRGSYIPYETKRYVVIPQEREGLLHKKLEQPLLKESVEKHKWNFVRYNDLEDLFNDKRKKKLNVKEIDDIARMPKLKNLKQSNFKEFE